MIRKLRVLADMILVKRSEGYETTKGGIFIKKDDRDIREEGTVLQIGPELTMKKPPVKEGDTICFERMAGRDVKWEGENYLIIQFDEVTAVHESTDLHQ